MCRLAARDAPIAHPPMGTVARADQDATRLHQRHGSSAVNSRSMAGRAARRCAFSLSSMTKTSQVGYLIARHVGLYRSEVLLGYKR